jgi:hypothetical protein
MRAQITTVGDGILYGRIVDTNPAFLGRRLTVAAAPPGDRGFTERHAFPDDDRTGKERMVQAAMDGLWRTLRG